MLEPFLKWPGGKRWLPNQYSAVFPDNYRQYVEPFLGAGAVFFHLNPKRAILSDSNSELVNVYSCIKTDVTNITVKLERLQRCHCKQLYYRVRDQRPRDAVGRAVRFLYLNRTCFNGIYRVNLHGDFNVPIGTKTAVQYPPEYLTAVASRLRTASIRTCDFEETLDRTNSGDFVYVDPPYTVMHNNNNFVKYNASLFSWADQVRLASAIKRAHRRGARIMISNADHDTIRDLYAGFGQHLSVCRTSILSAQAVHRRQTTELLIINYRAPRAHIEIVSKGRAVLLPCQMKSSARK